MTDQQHPADCGCGPAAGGADAPASRGPRRALASGMALGLAAPVIVGVISARFEDEPTTHAGMARMAGMDISDDVSWLGSPEWYYGAMAIVLAAGAVHALVRHGGRSCGSTPLGMGIMWGAMVAMALGMAAGIH